MKPPTLPDSFDDMAFRRKLYSVPASLVEKALLLYVILTDKDTPNWVRALVLAALVYLINPFDAVFDAVPILGYADDLSVIVLTLERISHYVTPKVKERAKAMMPRYFKASSNEAATPQTETELQPLVEAQSIPDNTNNNTENEEGKTNHDEEKEDNNGSGKVPYIERFRILP